MARITQWEQNNKKLRAMGLDPHHMTIRQRHEALFGEVKGESFVDLIARVNGFKEKRPSESESVTSTAKKPVNTRVEVEKPANHAQNAPDERFGHVLRHENVSIIEIPRSPRNNARKRHEFDAESLLRSVNAGPEAYRLVAELTNGRLTPKFDASEHRPAKKRTPKARGVVQMDIFQAYMHSVLECQ